MSDEKIVELMEAAAVEAANTCFTQDYMDDTTLDERKTEGAALALSKWSRWEGSTIVQISAEALEDANFHDLAGFFFALLEAMDSPTNEYEKRTENIAKILSDAGTQLKIEAA